MALQRQLIRNRMTEHPKSKEKREKKNERVEINKVKNNNTTETEHKETKKMKVPGKTDQRKSEREVGQGAREKA